MSQIEEMESAIKSNDYGKLFEKVKFFQPKKKQTIQKVWVEGKIVEDKKIVMEQFSKYFSQLLNVQNDTSMEVMKELESLRYERSMWKDISRCPVDDEIIVAMWALKNRKAVGPDDIVVEAIKFSGEKLMKRCCANFVW